MRRSSRQVRERAKASALEWEPEPVRAQELASGPEPELERATETESVRAWELAPEPDSA
ncbi:hypothetical protein SAMN04487785_109170 [Dyella jiangningensis]|nr:hypothetical protein BDW41_108168 [Dyella sp. AtDHG13]SDK65211.1 hypothetical protein SAMN04487785_109170 [Dyella jiangningensis]